MGEQRSKERMEPIYLTEVTKIKNGKKIIVEDTLIREAKLDIVVNGKKITSMMAVPLDLKELIIGYIIGEKIVDKVDDIKEIIVKTEDERNYEILIDAKTNQANIEKLNSEGVIVSGCGKAQSSQISPKAIKAKTIITDFSIKADLLFDEMQTFYEQCPLYEQTGCVHTAKIYIDKDTYFIGEDIAQHNTIDKAVGKALLNGYDITHSFLMVSGRLSSEMVAKAVVHQVPILASRTASTCRGLMIAQTFGLTLIGFVRGKSMNIYRNPGRVEI